MRRVIPVILSLCLLLALVVPVGAAEPMSEEFKAFLNEDGKLDLMEGVEKKLGVGGYEGKFIVHYYDQTTGEKAMVNTEIPITINVVG